MVSRDNDFIYSMIVRQSVLYAEVTDKARSQWIVP